MSEATHYTLSQFTEETQVTDGHRWSEAPINVDGEEEISYTVFANLEDAVDAARIVLSDQERGGDTMWRPYVNVIGHSGDPRQDAEGNEVEGWSAGWVNGEGEFVEGDYENDLRLYDTTPPTGRNLAALTRIHAGAPSQTLSEDALYMIVRGLADMGEDYGWNVYRRGYTIPAGERRRMLEMDEQAQAWLDAFDASVATFTAVTGKEWRY